MATGFVEVIASLDPWAATKRERTVMTRKKRVRPTEKKELRPERLETFWQLRGSSGKVFECVICRMGARLEMRVGYDFDDPVSASVVKDLEEARARAVVLKDIVLANGGFEVLPA